VSGKRAATALASLVAVGVFLWLVKVGANAFLGEYGRRLLLAWGINSVLAVSLNLINGHTGQFSLGHAGFMAVGAYTGALVALSHPEGFAFIPGRPGICLWVGALLLAAGSAAALAGALVAVPTFRLRGDYLAIATLGFGEVIFVILLNLRQTGGATGLGGIPEYTTVVLTFGVLALAVVTVKNLVASRFGRAFACIREDEAAAEAVGINTTKYKILAFTVGAFFAGTAGSLFALHEIFMVPSSFRFMKSVEIVIMCVLGGTGSSTGAILGAGVLTFLPEWLRLKERLHLSVDPRMMVFSALLVVVMLVRRQGILGSRELSFSGIGALAARARPRVAAGSRGTGRGRERGG